MQWHPDLGYNAKGFSFDNAKNYQLHQLNFGQAERLPSYAYTHKVFADLENEKIWTRQWVAVGFTEQLPYIGDLLPYTVGNHGIHIERVAPSTFEGRFNFVQHGGCWTVPTQCQTGKKTRCSYTSCGFSEDRTTQFKTNLNVESNETGHYLGFNPNKWTPIQTQQIGNTIFVNLANEPAKAKLLLQESNALLRDALITPKTYLDSWYEEVSSNWKQLGTALLTHCVEQPILLNEQSWGGETIDNINVLWLFPNLLVLTSSSLILTVLMQPHSPKETFLRSTLWRISESRSANLEQENEAQSLLFAYQAIKNTAKVEQKKQNEWTQRHPVPESIRQIIENPLEHEYQQFMLRLLLQKHELRDIPLVFKIQTRPAGIL